MACPYFDPLQALEGGGNLVPLGDVYQGVCRAGESPWTPEPSSLRRLCNLGYAEECPRFRRGNGPDAVRFAIAADAAGRIQVACALERDHLPLAHGRLEYVISAGKFLETRWEGLVERQAYAYLASYLRRRGPGNA